MAPRDGDASGGSALPHCVVVGAGFGGLAAALRARARGYRVTLIERQDMLGGRARTFEKGGFRHDGGPTVITAPFLFEELFQLFGKRLEDYAQLVPLDPWYRFRFADGSTFDYGGTVEDTCREIAKISPEDVEGYQRLLAHSEKLFDAGFTKLSATPFHRLGTMAREAGTLVRLRAQDTVWQMICRFLRHDKLRQAFSIQPLLVGGSPFDTTSIYGLIHFLERKWGVWFCMGGTGAMVAALGRLMAEEGIAVRLNATVEEITVSQGRATGVRLAGGERVAADIVVSNADTPWLFTHMLPGARLPLATRAKLKTARLSMGLFVLYFGTTRQYPDVAHHTIWLGARYKPLLDEIFKGRTLPDDFSLYLHRPTATDPSFAPPGCESFYVLCPVPNLNAPIDWTVEGPRLRERVVRALGDTILPGLPETITEAFYIAPPDFEHDYLSLKGSGFSLAPHFTQSAWFRFHNKAEGVNGLYLTGAGTHPGGGMPGALCSAKVVDALLPTVARHG